MNLPRTMSAVEYASDCAQEAIDEDAAHEERVSKYVEQRTQQIFEMRMANVSDEDFILAIDTLSALPTIMAQLRAKLYARDAMFPAYLMGAIDSALRADSKELAKTEANAIFGLERH